MHTKPRYGVGQLSSLTHPAILYKLAILNLMMKLTHRIFTVLSFLMCCLSIGWLFARLKTSNARMHAEPLVRTISLGNFRIPDAWH